MPKQNKKKKKLIPPPSNRTFSSVPKKNAVTSKQQQQQQQQQRENTPPIIPFDPEDRILLIGEGDFSFAASLITHHACRAVTATCYETTPAELHAKYPQAAEHIARITAVGEGEGEGEGHQHQHQHRVVYGVDATRLVALRRALCSGNGAQKEAARWDRVIFNFPHVGGKSTDVNRQVRYNQELLVKFFRSVIPLLQQPDGTIIVTLFEGEPYTLWNIRDLARSVGLTVARSFRFQSAVYPGYRHARTLGNLRGGGGGGAWKGEMREARSFVFQVGHGAAGAMMEGVRGTPGGPKSGAKRKRWESSASSAEDEDDDDGDEV